MTQIAGGGNVPTKATENPSLLMGFKSRITNVFGQTVDSNRLIRELLDSLVPSPRGEPDSKVTSEPLGDIEQVNHALDKLEEESHCLRSQIDALKNMLGLP